MRFSWGERSRTKGEDVGYIPSVEAGFGHNGPLTCWDQHETGKINQSMGDNTSLLSVWQKFGYDLLSLSLPPNNFTSTTRMGSFNNAPQENKDSFQIVRTIKCFLSFVVFVFLNFSLYLRLFQGGGGGSLQLEAVPHLREKNEGKGYVFQRYIGADRK